jgi:hypothetical protein
VDELARFLVLTERWPRLVDDFVRQTSPEHAASEADVPSDRQDSEKSAWRHRWRCVEEHYKDVQIPNHALTLFDGIDAQRLRMLCDWYGFRYHGDGEALKSPEPAPPSAQAER